MSEFIPGRFYSPTAQRVLDTFVHSPEDRAEYLRRGLIATNNLGFHMLVYNHGPNQGLGSVYFSSLSTRTCELLESVKSREPDLWKEALMARAVRVDLGTQYSNLLSTHGQEHPDTSMVGYQLDNAKWQEAEVMTRVFDSLEQGQLSPEEAMELCL